MEIHEVAPSRRLAVSLTGGRGSGYIVRHAHTHRGRIHVFCNATDDVITVSITDFESMSDDAIVWLAGFLSGSEPSIYEYLGVEGSYEQSSEEVARWYEFLERFGRDGVSYFLGKRPIREMVVDVDELPELPVPFVPWAFAGEVVWVPREDGWVPADPQPRLIAHTFLAGTACADREYHRYTSLRSDWRICDDCSNVFDETL